MLLGTAVMSSTNDSFDDVDSTGWTQIERLVEEFEQAWQGGQRPSIDDYLRGGSDRPTLLRQLIQSELECRLKAGEAARVEEYLTRYPELADERLAIIAFLRTEWRIRARIEPELSFQEYRQRFPELAQELIDERHTLASDDRPGIPATLDTRANHATVTTRAELPRIPGYEIEKELGRGAMGVVYKARQLGLDRVVALKMIRHAENASVEDRQRFQVEVRALARLKHPNIVQIHEVGEHQGEPFFALEFVEGGTLAERAARQQMPVAEAAKLTTILARAVHAAHEAKVVHRDLKPSNILLTQDGTPKISDFGLAKHLDAESIRTQSGAVFGTPAYMSPEQASGRSKTIGPAADIHALGVIFYELLAGQVPFRGVTMWDVLQQVQSAEPMSLRRLVRKLPRDVETICHKCLRKLPEARYRSALELAEDLERFLKGEPIRARPIPLWEHGIKWARRHPATAGLLAVILLGVVLAVGAWVKFTAYLGQALAQRTHELQAERQNRERELQLDLRLNRYVDDIRQAAQLWQRGEISQCYDFMTTRQGGVEGEDDPHDFEWHFLRRWCDYKPRLVLGNTAAVNGVRFHPNGKLLASCGEDQTIRFWEADTGEPRGGLVGHRGGVNAIAFSPDGKVLASAGHDHSVRLWDVAELRQLAVLIEGATPVDRLDFSPNGELLAFLWKKGTEAQLWDLKTRRVRHIWSSGADRVLSLAFAPDGRSVALGYGDGRIKLEDVATGSELSRLRARHSVHALAFASKSPLLAAAGSEGVVTLWDAVTRERVGELAGHTGTVNSLAFSPDDRTLISASEDGAIRSWDTVAQRPLAVFRVRNHPFRSVAFAPHGRFFASGGSDGVLGLWPTTVAEEAGTLQFAVDPAGPIAFSPDGKWLAAAGLDHTVRLLDSTTRRLRRTLHGWHGECQDLAFSPESKFLAAACSDHRVHVWETSSGQPMLQLLGHQDSVMCLAYSRDGKWLATGGADHRVALWDMPSGRLRTVREAHKGPITALAFHPEDDVLATASNDKKIQLWSIPDFQLQRQFPQDDEVLGMAFIDEGKALLVNGESMGVSRRDLTGKGPSAPASFTERSRFMANSPSARLLIVSDLGAIQAFNIHTRKKQFHLNQDTGIHQVALSPDGSRLVLNHQGGSLQWWDLTRHHIFTTPNELPYAVHSLAFSPDSEFLVTGSRGGGGRTIRTFPFPGIVYDRWTSNTVSDLVRFWTLPNGQSRQLISDIPTLVGQPFVAVSPDGRSLATGADDGTVTLWDLTTGQRRRHLFVSRHSSHYSPLLEQAVNLGVPINPKFDRDQMRAMTFSSDGRYLAAASEDGEVKLWQVPAGKEFAALSGEREDVSCLSFSPDGTEFAVNNGNVIELWSVDTTPVLRQEFRGCTGRVRSVAFSPDGKLLAGGTDNWEIRLWETSNGREMKTLRGHLGRVNSLVFHPNGRTLASAGWDGTVRLWHIATGRELMALRCNAPLLHTVAFSADGQILAAGGERQNGRGDVCFWRATP